MLTSVSIATATTLRDEIIQSPREWFGLTVVELEDNTVNLSHPRKVFLWYNEKDETVNLTFVNVNFPSKFCCACISIKTGDIRYRLPIEKNTVFRRLERFYIAKAKHLLLQKLQHYGEKYGR